MQDRSMLRHYVGSHWPSYLAAILLIIISNIDQALLPVWLVILQMNSSFKHSPWKNYLLQPAAAPHCHLL